MNDIIHSQLSRLQMLRHTMHLEQENLQLKQQVAELTSKAEALEQLLGHGEHLGFREVAKQLELKQNGLIELLINAKWLYRDKRNRLQAYQTTVQQGLVVYESAPVTTKDGEKMFKQVKITPLGVKKLTQLKKTLTPVLKHSNMSL